MKQTVKFFYLLMILISAIFISSFIYIKNPTIIEVETTKGKILIELYDETPIHKANFVKLVENGFYEGITFHRVIKNFMAQAGDPNSRNENFKGKLGQNSEGQTLPAEIITKYFHKKGALAAARQGDQINPEKKSSGSQFYIVQGQKHTRNQIKQMETRINQQMENAQIGKFLKMEGNEQYMKRIKNFQDLRLSDSLNILLTQIKKMISANGNSRFSFSEEAINIYETIGGTPFLDNGYTVFGEVIKGIEIIDDICSVSTREGDIPVEPISIIKMTILK